MKVIKYGITRSQDVQDLANRVGEFIKNGFEPIGGVAIATLDNTIIYSQAVVKYGSTSNSKKRRRTSTK